MGNYQGEGSKTNPLKMAEVSTDNLRQKLNDIYACLRNKPCVVINPGLFEYLWDLKELALLEGRTSIEVPTTWLKELEEEFQGLEHLTGNC